MKKRKEKEKADLFSLVCLHCNGLDCGKKVMDRSRRCCFAFHVNRITIRTALWFVGAASMLNSSLC